jgi:GntP family gluconate:H+ symporter
VTHGLVPPHPGAMAAIGILQADIGLTIFYSLLIGLPVAAVSGPLLAGVLARRVPFEPAGGMAKQFTETAGAERRLPGFGITLFTALLPVMLMLLATGVDLVVPPENRLRQVVDFVGDPVPAMLIAAAVSFYTLGIAQGFTRTDILRFSEECLAPIAGILLVIGAGGGFGGVLAASGVGDAVATLAVRSQVPPLVLGWLIAAMIRISIGSATVSITTAAGLVAPMLGAMPGVSVELMVLAMGAGSLIFSHVNDAGFWLVKEYFGMSVTQTLKTWSVVETVISVTALGAILLVDLVAG